MRSASAVLIAIALAPLAARVPATFAGAGFPYRGPQPDVSGLEAHVPPLKHPFPKGWQATLFWWQVPLSFQKPAKLKQELNILKERGLLPCVELNAEPHAKPEAVANCIAQGKAIAGAGFPVHIAMKGRLDLYKTPDGKRVRHADAPDPNKKDAVGETIPCLILKHGWIARADRIRGLMRKFADAKVPVAAVWYDYEGHPHPWNGVHQANGRCPSCRKQYPAGVLGDFLRFGGWVYDWRAKALADAFAKPVKAVFPSARTGFYGYVLTTAEHPVGGLAGRQRFGSSACNPAEIDVAQPVCYAWVRHCANHYFRATYRLPDKHGVLLTRQQIDPFYLFRLLDDISHVSHNVRPNQFVMPYVSSIVGDKKLAGRVPRMSKSLYREFLRHAILRGARGFYCFNVGPPYVPTAEHYAELADINVVYNELFAYREFLEGGRVLNDACPDPGDSTAVVWSGLRKGAQALVRVVTLGRQPTFTEIAPLPGKTVRLLASPTGRTYRVTATGAVRALD